MRRSMVTLGAVIVVTALVTSLVSRWLVTPQRVEAQAAAVTASTVTAQELRLVDGQGKVRLRASVSPEGEVFLSFRDANEAATMVLSAVAGGDPYIGLRDATGADRVALRVDAGTPHLDVYDSGGQRRLYLGQSTDGFPIFRIRDARNTERLFLGQQGDGTSTIYISNDRGGTIWSAP